MSGFGRTGSLKQTGRSHCWIRALLLLWIVITLSACGYHARSSIGELPDGIHSIGIPTFQNLTTQYRVEQIITRAVLKEFAVRTRIPVNSRSTGVDSVLLGEIKNISATPVTFGTQPAGSQTFGSAFLITVTMSVKLKRLKDSRIIWQNDNLLYRNRYSLNADIKTFFSEENPALDRLAREFAASLASTILNR